MENKFNETGSEFGNTVVCVTKSSSSHMLSKEPIDKLRAKWPLPEESKKLVLQLMGLVNTKQEYQELQADLTELEILTSSDLLKRRLCIVQF